MTGRRLGSVLGVAALVVALVASLYGNVRQYRKNLALYRAAMLVRIDPTSEMKFADAAVPARRDDELRIVFFGDSRVARWDPQPELPGATTIWRGVDGDTTAQLALRFERDVLALDPDAVVIQAGVNDLIALGVLDKGRTMAIRRAAERLRAMVLDAAARDIDVVLLSVFPIGEIDVGRLPVWTEETRTARGMVNATFANLDDPRVTYVDVDVSLAPAGTLEPAYAADHVHLTAAGYEIVNREVAAAVARGLLRRRFAD